MKLAVSLLVAAALVALAGCAVAPEDSPLKQALAASVFDTESEIEAPNVDAVRPEAAPDGSSAVFQDKDKQAADELKDLRRRVADLENKVGDGAGKKAAGDDDDSVSEAGGEDDATGTDPRAFGTKFMPYYRYTKLDNNVVMNEFVLFGLVRFDENVAVTYEIPVAKQMDYSDLSQFKNGMGIPENPGFGFPPGGVPFGDLESDGDVTGMGDTIFRFMMKSDSLRFDVSPVEGGQMEFMPILETTVPTATNDSIGGETLVVSPGFAFIMDMPAMGFIALMNFYDVDAWRDNSRDNISRFRGRWFYMQPLTPPAFMAEKDPDIPNLGLLSGLYLLPECQPVYDFETDDFSFWIAPEIGKIVREGLIFYAKPGWGIDLEPFDRKFTLECGMRWFF